jgi:hypothetical protein
MAMSSPFSMSRMLRPSARSKLRKSGFETLRGGK